MPLIILFWPLTSPLRTPLKGSSLALISFLMSFWGIKKPKGLVASNIILTSIKGVGYFFIITICYIGPLLTIITKNKIKSRRRRRGFSSIGLALS